MNRVSRGIVLQACAAVILALGLGTADAGEWKRVSIERFGFALDIPSSFKALPPPANNDGRTFDSPDGQSEILAYGYLLDRSSVADDARRSAAFAADDKVELTLNQVTRRGYVLSGLKQDRIVYERAIATCNGIAMAMLRVEYPNRLKLMFDPLIAHMSASLHGSNACWAPG